MMHICMFVYSFWPENVGGAENQCRRLITQFQSDQVKFTVLTGYHNLAVPQQEEISGYRIYRLITLESALGKSGFRRDSPKEAPTRVHARNPSAGNEKEREKIGKLSSNLARLAGYWLRFFNAVFFAFGALLFFVRNRKRISLIHVHTADWIAGLAAIAGRWLRIPVLCKGANLPVFPDLQGLPFPALLDRWRRRCFFIALTEAMKDDLVREGVPEKKIFLVANGVTLPVRTAEPANNATFLFVGNFSQTAAHKAFDVLFDAWRMVVAQRPEVRLVMVGGGDSTEWWNSIRQDSLEHTVTFAGYQKDLEEYYVKSGIFLLPSRKEGISNALLEAQSYGIPAVVSDIPGNREVVRDKVNGLVVPVGDSVALANAMMRLYDDAELRAKFGRAARNHIRDHFSMDSVRLKVEQIYQDLLR